MLFPELSSPTMIIFRFLELEPPIAVLFLFGKITLFSHVSPLLGRVFRQHLDEDEANRVLNFLFAPSL